MQSRYEPLSEPFSTADAEYPQIFSELGRLRVNFRDWQEKDVVLVFHDVVAYSWDDGEAALDANYRDDCSYVVHDSPWLARHLAVGNVTASKPVQHFMLCFNAAGVLQVLASRLEVQA